MCTQIVLNAFDLAKLLAKTTSAQLLAGDYARVVRCLNWAEKLLREGTSQERLAIANVFIYSVANTIDRLGRERRRVLALLPPLLRREYDEQVGASGS